MEKISSNLTNWLQIKEMIAKGTILGPVQSFWQARKHNKLESGLGDTENYLSPPQLQFYSYRWWCSG